VEATITKCKHCGDETSNPISFEGDAFCCDGCVSVYQIINGAGLNDFYKISENPGVKQKSHKHLDFLKNDEVVEGILHYRGKEYAIVSFVLPAVHCASCVWLLEKLPQLHSGILNSDIHFFKKRVQIRFSPEKVSVYEIARLLQSIGYEPVVNQKKQGRTNKSLLVRIGVAGFVFGNIMMLSFPDYVSDFDDTTLKKFFSYISIVLVLPVITFCSTVFYKNVWQSYKTRMLSIDIPIVLGIVALFGRSIYDIFWLSETGYLDSLAGLVFFLLLGKWFQGKVYDELSFEKSANEYLPLGILVKKGSEFIITPLSKVRKNDICKIRANEVVPFDSKLLSEKSLLDTAFITGESIPESLQNGDKIFCGSKVINGFIEIEVLNTERGQLFDVWQKKNPKIALDNTLVKYFTITVLLAGCFTFLYHYIVNSAETAFIATTSVWIVACPCALALVNPTLWGLYIRQLSKLGYFIKSAEIIERIRNVKNLVFDKTGTITGKEYSCIWKGEKLKEEHQSVLLSMCESALHPISDIIRNKLVGTTSVSIEGFEEIPGLGMKANYRGISYLIGNTKFVGIKDEEESNIITSWLKIGDKNFGCFQIELPNRDGLDSLFEHLRTKYELHLISGDSNLNVDLFSKWFNKNNIRKGSSPVEKQNYIMGLQKEGQVLMIGDGLNDSLALQTADVGISVVEEKGAFFPECDGICFGQELNTLGKVLELVRSIGTIKKLSFAFSITYNLIGFYLAFNLMLSPLIASVLMPLSSITVVGLIWGSFSFLANRKTTS
jgi:Cu+-exporting ATPase